MKRLLIWMSLLLLLQTSLQAQNKKVVYVKMHIWPPESKVTLTLDTNNASVVHDELNDLCLNKPQCVSSNGAINFLLPYADNHYLYKVECEGYVPQYGSFFSQMQLDMHMELSPVGTAVEINPNQILAQADSYWYRKKYRKAHKLYKIAAENGNALAMLRLSRDYQDGKGCLRNIRNARIWLECAENSGSEEAYWSLQMGSYKIKRH